MKRYSTALAIKEMQLKTTLRHHCTAIRVAKPEILITSNAGEDKEQLGHAHIAVGSVKWSCHFGKWTN